MRTIILSLAAALALAPAAASAQSVAEDYGYKEPSGMFGDGHTIWNFYKYLHEDQERTARLNAARNVESTGSIGTEDRQLRRPVERAPGTAIRR